MKNFIGFAKNLYKGRIGRMDYFLGVLTLSLALVPMVLVISLLAVWFSDWVYVLGWLISIVMYEWIAISLIVRRLHDSEKSAWNIAWSLIPFFGALFLLILLLASKGQDGENKYGSKIEGVGFFKRILNLS